MLGNAGDHAFGGFDERGGCIGRVGLDGELPGSDGSEGRVPVEVDHPARGVIGISEEDGFCQPRERRVKEDVTRFLEEDLKDVCVTGADDGNGPDEELTVGNGGAGGVAVKGGEIAPAAEGFERFEEVGPHDSAVFGVVFLFTRRRSGQFLR